jgi:hypothetical protein
MYVSDLKGSTNKTGRSALNVQDFTMECLTICWYMVVCILESSEINMFI